MSTIQITNLTFCYDTSFENVFTNVSLRIDTDWKLGLCGRNGRGKTTLLKLLMGEYAYEGTITAGVAFDYFPLSVANKDDLVQEILFQIAPNAEQWQMQKELSLLACDEGMLYRTFSTLSNGEQTKVIICGLFLRENNFLLIDEPTNHLDADSRKAVARYLKNKSGFILVSHDRAFLDDCVDHILSINRSGIELISGNFSTWAAQKQLRDASAIAKNERLKQEIGRLKRSAAQTADWAQDAERSKYGKQKSGLKADRGYVGHKAAKVMKRSKAMQQRTSEAIAEKATLLKNVERIDELKLQTLFYHSNRLINLNDVSIHYGGNVAVQNLSFELMQGMRLALCGKNGSGKSSILKLLCGDESLAYTGQVCIASGLNISYLPQDTGFLKGSFRSFCEQYHVDVTQMRNVLHRLDFSHAQLESDLSGYSAGQKKKLLLAKSLCQPSHLYIWDEPLNYIDVLSRMQIEDLLLSCQPTMIFVEHDQAFCDLIATDTLNL